MMKIISMTLFSTLFSVSAYAATECIDDGTSVVVLPDCTTIEINTCYKGVTQSTTTDDLPVDIVVDSSSPALEGTAYCGQPADDIVGCVAGGDLASTVVVGDIVKRNNKPYNATPARGGKGTANADCDNCPSRAALIDVTMTNKKNAHFDLLLEESDSNSTDVCKVGFNAHSKIEELQVTD